MVGRERIRLRRRRENALEDDQEEAWPETEARGNRLSLSSLLRLDSFLVLFLDTPIPLLLSS